MLVNWHSALFVLTVAAILAPLNANAVEVCKIIESAIDYRYATHERDICAEDAYLQQKFCLRRENKGSFLSTDKIDLIPSGENVEAPRLKTTINLDGRVKENIKNARREVSLSRSVLNKREKAEAAKTDGGEVSKLLSMFANSDMISLHYERSIKRVSRTKGPIHPQVIELQKNYEVYKKDRERAVSKTTAQLKVEVNDVDRNHFELLKSEYAKHLHIDGKITQVLDDWENLSWQAPLDCTDKITVSYTHLTLPTTPYV